MNLLEQEWPGFEPRISGFESHLIFVLHYALKHLFMLLNSHLVCNEPILFIIHFMSLKCIKSDACVTPSLSHI